MTHFMGKNWYKISQCKKLSNYNYNNNNNDNIYF